MKRFKNILFVADGSKGEDAVLSRAATLADANGARLTLFDAIHADEFVPSDPDLAPALNEIRETHLEARRQELETLRRMTASSYPSLEVSVDVRVGNTARLAVGAVVADEYDLVIKAPQGGVQRLNMLFGSTDQKLMRKCPCPVWLVRPTGGSSFQKIVAAVEIDPNEAEAGPLARQIMELSTSLAEREGAELHVVHAWHLAAEAKLKGGQIDLGLVERIIADMESTHRASVNALVADYPYDRTEVHVLKGDAGDVISDFVHDRDADLVVIGTVARSGIPGLLMGNTAERVVSTVDCSVLTLKPEGFKTPLET